RPSAAVRRTENGPPVKYSRTNESEVSSVVLAVACLELAASAGPGAGSRGFRNPITVQTADSKTTVYAATSGASSLTHRRLDAFERENPHPLASVDRALVRLGLDHELVAIDGVEAYLISPQPTSVPFD